VIFVPSYLKPRHFLNYKTLKSGGAGGCPECTNKTKHLKTREANLKKLQERFDILSEYDGRVVLNKTNIHVNVTVRNKTCGHTFTSTSKNLLTRDVECGVCGPQKRIAAATAWSKANSLEWQKTANEWDKYRHRVYMLTRSTYNKHKSTINPQNLPKGLAGKEGAFQLDHIKSVRWCFENNIPAIDCAAKSNLQMLPWLDNLIKR
jgi:hypothetical protein